MKKSEVFCEHPRLIFRKDINRFLASSNHIDLYIEGVFIGSYHYNIESLYTVYNYVVHNISSYYHVYQWQEVIDYIDTDDVIINVSGFNLSPLLFVTCGKCNCCASTKATSLTARTDLILMHTKNISFFVTFEIGDYSPYSYSLVRDFIGNIMRRFQSEICPNISYHIRGEYGNNCSYRPHYHVMIHDYIPSINRNDYDSFISYRKAVQNELLTHLQKLYYYRVATRSDSLNRSTRYNIYESSHYDLTLKKLVSVNYLMHGYIQIEPIDLTGKYGNSAKKLSSYISSYVATSDSLGRFTPITNSVTNDDIDIFYQKYSYLFPKKSKDIYKYFRTYFVFDTKVNKFRLSPFNRYSQLYGFKYFNVDDKNLSSFFYRYPKYKSFKSQFIKSPCNYINPSLLESVTLLYCYDRLHSIGEKSSQTLDIMLTKLREIGIYINMSVRSCIRYIKEHSSYDFLDNYDTDDNQLMYHFPLVLFPDIPEDSKLKIIGDDIPTSDNSLYLDDIFEKIYYICSGHYFNAGFPEFVKYIDNLKCEYQKYLDDYDFVHGLPRVCRDRTADVSDCVANSIINFKKRKL